MAIDTGLYFSLVFGGTVLLLILLAIAGYFGAPAGTSPAASPKPGLLELSLGWLGTWWFFSPAYFGAGAVLGLGSSILRLAGVPRLVIRTFGLVCGALASGALMVVAAVLALDLRLLTLPTLLAVLLGGLVGATVLVRDSSSAEQ